MDIPPNSAIMQQVTAYLQIEHVELWRQLQSDAQGEEPIPAATKARLEEALQGWLYNLPLKEGWELMLDLQKRTRQPAQLDPRLIPHLAVALVERVKVE